MVDVWTLRIEIVGNSMATVKHLFKDVLMNRILDAKVTTDFNIDHVTSVNVGPSSSVIGCRVKAHLETPIANRIKALREEADRLEKEYGISPSKETTGEVWHDQ